MKGSGASEYLGIGPKIDLKEHYYPKGDGHFNQVGSDPFANRNPFIVTSCIPGGTHPENGYPC